MGHNWLRHDLVELAKHIDVTNLISKSTDTLLILKSRNDGSYGGIGMESIAQFTFQLTKKHKQLGEKVHDIWMSDPPRAYRYNHWDCYLAFRIWHHLITKHEVCTYDKVRMGDGSLCARYLKIDEDNVRHLVTPHFNYRLWKRWRDKEKEMLPIKKSLQEYRPAKFYK